MVLRWPLLSQRGPRLCEMGTAVERWMWKEQLRALVGSACSYAQGDFLRTQGTTTANQPERDPLTCKGGGPSKK